MMLKDLKLAQEAAAQAGATTPMGNQAEAIYALFDRLGFGGKDFSRRAAICCADSPALKSLQRAIAKLVTRLESAAFQELGDVNSLYT